MRLWGIGAIAFSLAVVAGGLVSACSDSNLGTAQGGDGGAGGCPTNPPANGSTCLLANNTSCNYGAAETPNCTCCGGGTTTYLCSNGKWEEEATAGSAGAGTGAAPACPETLPEAGTACTVYSYGGCEGVPQELCSYPCGVSGQEIAQCPSGSWVITTSGTCDDDAGTDDAGDGGDASDGG